MNAEDHDTSPAGSGWLAAGIVTGLLLFGAVLAVFVLVGTTGRSSHQAGQPPLAEPAPAALLPDRPGLVNVQVGDLWVKTSSRRVPPGPTTFSVENVGGAFHDLMIERVPIEMKNATTPVEEAAEGGVEGLSPGARKTMRVDLRPGRYELFCSVPSHFAGGAHALIDVADAPA